MKENVLIDLLADIQMRLDRLEGLHGRLDRDVKLDQTMEPPTRPTKVHVVRYIRKPNHWLFSNLGGATVAFELDYDRKIVTAVCAICREDENFEKMFGHEVAMERLTSPYSAEWRDENAVQFPLEMIDQHGGLVKALCAILNHTHGLVVPSWQKIHNKMNSGEWK